MIVIVNMKLYLGIGVSVSAVSKNLFSLEAMKSFVMFLMSLYFRLLRCCVREAVVVPSTISFRIFLDFFFVVCSQHTLKVRRARQSNWSGLWSVVAIVFIILNMCCESTKMRHPCVSVCVHGLRTIIWRVENILDIYTNTKQNSRLIFPTLWIWANT